MKPIKQTKMRSQGDDHGNCVQAAIASLLELELDQVPDFVALHGVKWVIEARDWFENQGIQLIWRTDKNPLVLDGYYLAAGKTARETRHMVVMKDGKFAHDPHPSDAFLAEIDTVFFLVPHDPARLMK